MIVSSVSWIDLVTLLVLPVLLPLLVGYVTKVQTVPTFWKRMILAGLALLTTVLTELVQSVVAGIPYDIGITILWAVVIYIAAEATYHGFLKAPIGAPIVTTTTALPPRDFARYTVAELRAMLGDTAPSGARKADLVRIAEDAEFAPITITTVEQSTRSIASMVQERKL